MLQILPYLLLKKIHFATLYLIYKEEKLYPLQVNRDASAPVFVVGSVNVFNVPFSLFLKFNVWVMLMLEAAFPAPLLSFISIKSIVPPEPLTRALVIVAFAQRRILITSCIRSTLSVVLAALFTIVIFSTVKSD